MFDKIKALLGLAKKPDTPTSFLVRSKHKDTHVFFTQEFETAEELDAYLESYQPTAHLNYVSTTVYACYGKKRQLIEIHEHITGNPEWEYSKFRDIAASLGAEIEQLDSYPNQSSAVSTVARFTYD